MGKKKGNIIASAGFVVVGMNKAICIGCHKKSFQMVGYVRNAIIIW